MKRAFLIFAMLGLAGCTTHVPPGYVGVEINSCSGGGVNPTPVGVGYHQVGPCTTIVSYPTFVQTAVWTKDLNEGNPKNEEITFTNADQMQIAADISVAYQLTPAKVPAFYAKFRADELNTFTHGFLRNMAREEFDTVAGKYKIEQIMGDNAGFLTEVKDRLEKDLSPYGVVIDQFGFVDAPRPPENVIQAINAKISATQKAMQIENELKQAQAEAQKQIAQAEGQAKSTKLKADAEAYANQVVAKSLTPSLVEYERVKRWDGKMPQMVGSGNPFVSLK